MLKPGDALPENRISNDTEIKNTIEDRLYWDTHVNESEIHVRVADGDVALEGTVPTSGAKEAATQHAETLSEVGKIKNTLTVWDSQRPKEHTDAELAERIARILSWEIAIRDQLVKAQVDMGTVTLTGVVESQSARRNIEEQIRRVMGVLQVVNQLTVVPAILL